jgi:arylsulfatase A-like enzyme
MHADLVPTLLGAAAIEYADKRSDAVDLTRASPGPRVRWVSKRLGSTLDGDSLR